MAKIKTRKPQPTVEEIIATLKKTSLPTVICEGSDDLIIYRRFEDRLKHIGISVLPAGGRKNVLQIFDRRSEVPPTVQLAFLADQDTWINSGIPASYVVPSMIFTNGYSIENDVFEDGDLESLLVGAEVAAFQRELDEFLDWYALALTRHLSDSTNPIALHPDHILDPAQRLPLLALKPGETYPMTMKMSLTAAYKTQIRGKSLMGLLIRNTNSRGGQPKHTDRALLEVVAARPGPLLARLHSEVEAAFVG